MVKFLLAQSIAKQENSFPIESRVQGNEVKPQQGCANFQHRDKPQEASDGFQQAENKNGLSMEMAEDQNCESRVQGNEVKPQDDCDDFQHRDENNRFSIKMAEDQTSESRVQANEVKPLEGGDRFQQVDRKKESSLHGKRVKLQEGFDGFQ